MEQIKLIIIPKLVIILNFVSLNFFVKFRNATVR